MRCEFQRNVLHKNGGISVLDFRVIYSNLLHDEPKQFCYLLIRQSEGSLPELPSNKYDIRVNQFSRLMQSERLLIN